MNQIKLKVGESKRIGSLFTGITIIYCGMPTDKSFSLGLKESAGHRGYSFNLYFSTKNKRITIKNKNLNIIKVTPDEFVVEELQ